MNVLSLFDGMSAGQLALHRANIKIDKYYASEIEKYSIKVTMKNFPNTIQLGNILDWKNWSIEKPDLILGGFPCQPWSVAGKHQGWEDARGGNLITSMFNIIDMYKPKYIILENVKGIINKTNKPIFNMIMTRLSQALYPSDLWDEIFFLNKDKNITTYKNKLTGELQNFGWYLINSALVSAQNRERVYITNVPIEGLPKDKGIMLKDIIHENTDLVSIPVLKNNSELSIKSEKSNCIDSNYFKGIDNHGQRTNILELKKYMVHDDRLFYFLNKEVERGKIIGYFSKDSQGNRVYSIYGKSITLVGSAGGGSAKMGQYLFGCLSPDFLNKNNNGPRFNNGEKFYTLTAIDRHGIFKDGYIRKLSPIECEKLQTFPPGYSECIGVSDSARYKMLGNGWTVDIIAWIFSFIKQ